MKRYRYLLPIALLCLAATAGAHDAEQKLAPRHETRKATYLISGLHCPPCTRTVETSLRNVKEVRSIDVDWKSKLAKISFDETLVPAQRVAQLIAATQHMMGNDMHYGGWLMLKLPDVKDEASAKSVKAVVAKVDGVARVIPYPAQQSIGIRFESKGSLTSSQLVDRLKKSGSIPPRCEHSQPKERVLAKSNRSCRKDSRDFEWSTRSRETMPLAANML